MFTLVMSYHVILTHWRQFLGILVLVYGKCVLYHTHTKIKSTLIFNGLNVFIYIFFFIIEPLDNTSATIPSWVGIHLIQPVRSSLDLTMTNTGERSETASFQASLFKFYHKNWNSSGACSMHSPIDKRQSKRLRI